MTLAISAAFDSGAITVIRADDPGAIDLAIRPDRRADGTDAEFLQWFHVRISGAPYRDVTIRIVNAGATTYPNGWRDYRAVASQDRATWYRVPTEYDGSVMTIRASCGSGPLWIAYFEPYSHERHLDLLSEAGAAGARVERLCTTVMGRDLDAVSIGTGPRHVWVIARQHPGESMAQWCAEGMLKRLLDAADPVARELLLRATVHVVPNMNPDGSALGNLRTNAAGANLNREWMAPSATRSPEVLAVREAIGATGCDAFLDLHGDENLPYVFVAGSEMLPDFDDAQRAQQAAFIADFRMACPDFQTRFGYSSDKYREDVLKLASKYVGHRFRCLSLTLEMPFKDNADAPDATTGWDGERSAHVGAALLDPLYWHLLRLDGG